MEGNGPTMRPIGAKWRKSGKTAFAVRGPASRSLDNSPDRLPLGPGEKHAAAVLSRCRLKSLRARTRPGRENDQHGRCQEGGGDIARAVQHLPAVQDAADRRPDRLPDIEDGGV